MRLPTLLFVALAALLEPSRALSQESVLTPGTYNMGSRYIQIAQQGARLCYQGSSFPSGRYAIAVGETTGSLSYEAEEWVADGWQRYGRRITLQQSGESLIVNLDDTERSEYAFMKFDEEYSSAMLKCLNSKKTFFEAAPGYSIQNRLVGGPPQVGRQRIKPGLVKTATWAYIIDPPSNVRVVPNGAIICSVKERRRINTYGFQGEWFYTDACGKMGMIHVSQIKF